MVEINNITSAQIDERMVKDVIGKVLQGEGAKGDISIAFVGPRTIKKINKQFRGKNKVTDVLSFSERERNNEWLPAIPGLTGENFLGEIIICLKRVKKNAKREGSDFRSELRRVIIHGVLHILGYDHQKEEEARIMEKKENKYLSA